MKTEEEGETMMMVRMVRMVDGWWWCELRGAMSYGYYIWYVGLTIGDGCPRASTAKWLEGTW